MKFIAFLRGINVGKSKLIKMKDLKDIFQSMGYSNIKTYLRSGNIVFETTDSDIPKQSLDLEELSNKISKNVEKYFGAAGTCIETYFHSNVLCIVKDQKELKSLIENNPYDDNPIEELYITIFKYEIDKTLSKELIKESKNIDTEDKFTICEKEIYLLCKSGYHKTKFNNNYFESKLNNIATTRNWKRMIKIQNMFNQQ